MHLPPNGEYIVRGEYIDTRDGADVWLTLPRPEQPEPEPTCLRRFAQAAKAIVAQVAGK